VAAYLSFQYKEPYCVHWTRLRRGVPILYFTCWWFAAIALPGCSDGKKAAERQLAEELRYQDREMARYEAEVSRIQAELMRKFDSNNDGIISGSEEKAYQTFLAKVRSGQTPNPFANISSPGSSPH
jgi:hypothetical protein